MMEFMKKSIIRKNYLEENTIRLDYLQGLINNQLKYNKMK